MESNIEARTSTTLSMTPRLQQAIRLLQLSTTELSTYLNEQVAENPLLILENTDQTLPLHTEDSQDFSNEFDEDSPNTSLRFEERDSTRQGDAQNPRLKSEQTLQDYLQLQLSLVAESKDEYHVGVALINYLNPAGYLDLDESELAAQLEVHVAVVKKMINTMQKFDPIGIFSRNVEECLRIQLQGKNLLTPQIEIVLQNLSGLLQGSAGALARKCQMSTTDLQQCLSVIRKLNPRPASEFLDNTHNDSVIPDGFIYKNSNDIFVFELNAGNIPHVSLDNSYYYELRQTIKKSHEKQFLQAKFAHANWLLKAVQQSLVTLQRVAGAITQHQQEFFAKGIQYLKPLTLKTVADQLDMHESTVSRITTAKYINTPRGTFELKFFFCQSLTSISEGQIDVSAKSVQNAIVNLINQESQNIPLSDEQLVAKLGENGMLVARRTISKYRKILKIPSSQERRNHYTLGLRKA